MGRTLAIAISAVVGLAAGPWLSLVADRLPEKKALSRPWWPTPNGPIITTATILLFAGLAARVGAAWALPGFLVFGACLVVVTVTDLRHFLILNRVIYPTLAASVVLLSAATLIGHDTDAFKRAAIGGLAAWFAMLVIHLISPRGMAFGDVRLSAVIGVYTGWLGYDHVVLALFTAFITAAIVGLILVTTRRRGTKDPVPFGPFLAVGAATAVLYGTSILHWYKGQ